MPALLLIVIALGRSRSLTQWSVGWLWELIKWLFLLSVLRPQKRRQQIFMTLRVVVVISSLFRGYTFGRPSELTGVKNEDSMYIYRALWNGGKRTTKVPSESNLSVGPFTPNLISDSSLWRPHHCILHLQYTFIHTHTKRTHESKWLYLIH